ncbi:MAG: hypothetical protein WBD27_11085 [Pyrinomonadaceae bacterium]
MIPEIGRFALIIAMMIAVAQAALPLLGAARRDGRAMAFGDTAAAGQALFVTIAFACLLIAFATSDFSVRLVAETRQSRFCTNLQAPGGITKAPCCCGA